MKLLFLTLTVALSFTFCAAEDDPAEDDPKENRKVVCYWNSTSFKRPGLGKFEVEDLKPALESCTHLIYGFAGIDARTFEIQSLNPNLDTGVGYGFYKLVIQLKSIFPKLKVYLSIGGNADPYEETHKYLTVLETQTARNKLISSILRFLSNFEFDGIDLAWQFPPARVTNNRGILGSFWHGIKKTIGYSEFQDKKEKVHKNGFTNLIRDLKTELSSRNKALTLSILPHVDASIYYAAKAITPNIDAIHLLAFDQSTPERNPKEADYPAPIYEPWGRSPQNNINASVGYWLDNETPSSKIIVGIPAFARTWKLTSASGRTGTPPVVTDGPGAAGLLTETPGFMSYAEVCSRLKETTYRKLRRVGDPSKKYGVYAYQPYSSEALLDGIWIGYEDPDTAGNKAAYAKAKNLGGVAIWDLSTDDFDGTCTGDKYPIVKAVKLKL